jgi:murein DD-endopeptidase MepM/ murein hydrolase activator NlpD/muramidase (phage lysozyme)
MVVTLRPYVKSVIGKPNYDQSASIRFAFRLLTRTGSVLRDFGTLDKFIVGYSDSHGDNGAQWTIRLKNTGESRELLRDLHPGIVAEIYASRGADPLEGVLRNPRVPRKDSAPDFPAMAIPTPVTSAGGGASDIGALTTGIYEGMHPNVAAFLEMLRDGEGTLGDKGFTTMFTGAQFSGFADHPRQIQGSGRLRSDAAGAYQFLSTTWDPIAARLGLKDFSPRSQALAAQEKLKDRGIYEAVVRGDLVAALGNASYEWASLPSGPGGGGRYGQPNHTYEEVVKIFEQAKQAIGGRVSADPNAVGPAFQPPPATAPQVAKVSAGPDTSRAGKVTLRRSGVKNGDGLEILKLVVHDKSGNPISRHDVVSGIAQTQDQFGGFGSTKAGSRAPLELGEYRIAGAIESGLPGVGKTFIPIDPTQASDRSAIGFHVDQDAATNPGTKGCVAFATVEDFDKFQAALSQSGATTFIFEKETATETPTAAPTAPAASTGTPIGEPVPPTDDASGLDKSPCLLMRGIICQYGRQGTTSGPTLTISGEDFGLVYREATVIAPTHAPELANASIEERAGMLWQEGITLTWYRLLSRYVERLNTGAITGIEARTRVLPIPHKIITKIIAEGSVWENLKRLALAGLYHCKIDHTGAIDWAKKPFSGRDQALVPGQSWEDVPMYDLEPWQVISIDDRYTDRAVTNYLRVSPSIGIGVGGDTPNVGLACTAWNEGSRVQYGSTKLELQFPMGLPNAEQWYQSDALRTQQATGNTLSLLSSCEIIRWLDRPVQAMILTVRGDAFLRIGTRLKIAETWNNLGAKPGEYYVLSRNHSIDMESGSWTTTLDVVRDRRTRYLGIGDAAESPMILNREQQVAIAAQSVGKLTPYTAWPGTKSINSAKSKKPAIAPSDLKLLPLPDVDVPISPDDYTVCHVNLGGCVRVGPDIIGWAKREVIPMLGKLGKVRTVTPPTGDTGSVQTGPAGPGGRLIAPFRSGLALGSVYDPAGTLNTRGRPHRGVDLFPSNEGDDTMLAVADGIVTVQHATCPNYRDDNCGGGYGNYFDINLTGNWSGWKVRYAHCNKIFVTSGQTVKAGQSVGLMGTSGGSDGPHIHFEVFKGGDRVNPMRYLPAPSQRFTSDAGADYLAGG